MVAKPSTKADILTGESLFGSGAVGRRPDVACNQLLCIAVAAFDCYVEMEHIFSGSELCI